MNTTPDTTPTPTPAATEAHCKIGPSSLPARSVCPCHDSAPGGADAESGTRAHAVVATILRGITPYYSEATTADEIERGEWGAAKILALRDGTAEGAQIWSERRIEFFFNGRIEDEETRHTLAGKFGTVDAYWESPSGEHLYIADFKTYAMQSDEKSYLPQGMYYAALLRSMLAPNATEVTFYVVAAGDHSVTEYRFEMGDAIRRTVATIRRVEAVQPGALFRDGAEARAKCGKPSVWCKYCAHAADCPAISRAVSLVNGGGILEKPLAVRYAIIPVLESFAKRVKDEVRAALERGERVYDADTGIEYALAERRGRPKLADLKGLAEAVIAQGVQPQAFAQRVSISKSAVEELLKAADTAAGIKRTKNAREAVYSPFFAEGAPEKIIKKIS